MTDLEVLFRQHAPAVYAYARRHVGADAADDVVSETFLVAWRRRDQTPDCGLPWLLVTARNVIANDRRLRRRRERLWLAAVDEFWRLPHGADPQEALATKEIHLEGLRACTPSEREALLLVSWDGLSIDDAARVAGCSSRAFTVRLSRARSRLQRVAGTTSFSRPPATPAHTAKDLA